MTDFDPNANRIVEASVGHPGMTQINRGGRCFQIGAVGPDAERLIELHADAVINGEQLPEYGRRWPDASDRMRICEGPADAEGGVVA
jgi:hypothetical protein